MFCPQEGGSQDLGEINSRYWGIMKGWKQTGGDLLVYEGKTTILEVKVKNQVHEFQRLTGPPLSPMGPTSP